MTNGRRRWLLHDAVGRLEPEAHSTAIHALVQTENGLDLPLLRLYVDLEHLVAERYLIRRRQMRPGSDKPAFFWETTGKVLVEPNRPYPRADAAEAPLLFETEMVPN